MEAILVHTPILINSQNSHKITHIKYVNSYFRKSAPQFLLDVYRRLIEEENDDEPAPSVRSKRDLQEQENFITDLDKRAIEESDIIMTFLNKSKYFLYSLI